MKFATVQRSDVAAVYLVAHIADWLDRPERVTVPITLMDSQSLAAVSAVLPVDFAFPVVATLMASAFAIRRLRRRIVVWAELLP